MDLNLSIKMVNSITLGPIVNSLPMKLAGISRSKTHILLIPLNATKQTPGHYAPHCAVHWVIKGFSKYGAYFIKLTG